MKRQLMYNSIKKKFIVKHGEKLNRHNLGELTTAQMQKAQDNPDEWVWID